MPVYREVAEDFVPVYREAAEDIVPVYRGAEGARTRPCVAMAGKP